MVRKQPIRRTSRIRRPRLNPSAEKIAREFHGRDPIEMTYEDHVEYPSELAVLGKLIEFWTKDCKLDFSDDDLLLASDADGKQLFVLGKVDIPYTKPMDIVGVCTHVVYLTDKPHLGDHSNTEYIHKFGEDGGSLPVLIYDAMNKQLFLVGGDYVIKREGIVN